MGPGEGCPATKGIKGSGHQGHQGIRYHCGPWIHRHACLEGLAPKAHGPLLGGGGYTLEEARWGASIPLLIP